MLGDELLDVFLVYPASVFALEPSTVRVREVGVGRNERRQQRRERERQARDEAALARARADADDNDEPLPPRDTVEVATPTLSPESSRIEWSSAPNSTNTTSATATGPRTPVSNPQSPPVPAKTAHPYCTFQQLQTIPPVPPSVLAASFLIPPTYDSVVNATGRNNTRRQGLEPLDEANEAPPQPVAPPSPSQAPLLSPISLLTNHLSRNSSPPGLFFVSRGRHSTVIVDGDGRAVTRLPVRWRQDETYPEGARELDIFHRVEALTVDGGKQTVIVGIGPTDIQAVHIDGSEQAYAPAIEVCPLDAARRRVKATDALDGLRDVTFLGKLGERLYWSERIGPSVGIHVLHAV
jgi:hypothetical protein